MEQAVLVYFRLSEPGFGSPWELEVLRGLAEDLREVVADAAVGEFDGHEVGEGQYTLYLYGPDADELFDAIEPMLVQAELANRLDCSKKVWTARRGGTSSGRCWRHRHVAKAGAVIAPPGSPNRYMAQIIDVRSFHGIRFSAFLPLKPDRSLPLNSLYQVNLGDAPGWFGLRCPSLGVTQGCQIEAAPNSYTGSGPRSFPTDDGERVSARVPETSPCHVTGQASRRARPRR